MRKMTSLLTVYYPSPSPQRGEAAEAEPEVEDDAGTKLSMSEKLALFNKLSQPILGSPVRDGSPLEASERRRQKGARYRTQPITVDEVNFVSVFGVHKHTL